MLIFTVILFFDVFLLLRHLGFTYTGSHVRHMEFVETSRSFFVRELHCVFYESGCRRQSRWVILCQLRPIQCRLRNKGRHFLQQDKLLYGWIRLIFFRSASKMTHADWLLNSPIRFLHRTGKFRQKDLRDDFNEI